MLEKALYEGAIQKGYFNMVTSLPVGFPLPPLPVDGGVTPNYMEEMR